MCTLALSHELHWNEIGYEGAFLCVFSGKPGSSVGYTVHVCLSYQRDMSWAWSQLKFIIYYYSEKFTYRISSYKTHRYYFSNCLLLKGQRSQYINVRVLLKGGPYKYEEIWYFADLKEVAMSGLTLSVGLKAKSRKERHNPFA